MSQRTWLDPFEIRVQPDKHLLGAMTAVLGLAMVSASFTVWLFITSGDWVAASAVAVLSAALVSVSVYQFGLYADRSIVLGLDASGVLRVNAAPVVLRSIQQVGHWSVWDVRGADRKRLGVIVSTGACGANAAHRVRLAGHWLLTTPSAGPTPTGAAGG